MELVRNLSEGVAIQCDKCLKAVKNSKDEKANQTATVRIPYMIDQPTVFENIRQKICLKCKHKIAYYTGREV